MNLDTENNLIKTNNSVEEVPVQTVEASSPSETSEPVEKKKIKSLPIILFLLLLIIGSLTYIFLMTRRDEVVEVPYGSDSVKEIEEITEGLSGEIYLTLSSMNSEKRNIYKLDVGSMELEEVFPDSEYRNYMASFSPDGENMVFVRVYEDNTSQILSLEISTGELLEVTSRSDLFPRNPKFSSDGEKIVYWVSGSYSEEAFGFNLALEDHGVYISTMNGKLEEICSGIYPKFSPTGEQILFMKTDGLYLIDLLTRKEQLVIEMLSPGEDFSDYDFEWGWNYRYNLSESGTFLITTDTLGPKENNSFYEISSWAPFMYERISSIEFSEPNWPVFSPEESYLVLQESEENLGLDTPKLSIYELSIDGEFTEVRSISLDSYVTEGIWITDWIIK